jgi:hypothetical protein
LKREERGREEKEEKERREGRRRGAYHSQTIRLDRFIVCSGQGRAK